MSDHNPKKVGRARGAVTPAGFEGIATAGTLSAIQTLLACSSTVNSAAELLECSEMETPNAVTLAEVPADGWYLISPLGSFPEPDGSYRQIFGVAQAEEVVSTFNSLSGRAARGIKNMWHGFGLKLSVPIFEGHSDRDPKRWPTMNRLGEINDLRAGGEGLWGLVTWNAAGLAKRTREFGPLKPSPIFWHEAKDSEGRVFPALLESVGLVRHPNISTAPVWTQNAAPTFPGNPPDETTTKKTHIMDLRKLLGLTADVTDEQVAAAIGGLQTTANASAAAITTANTAAENAAAELVTANAALVTANDRVTTLTGEVGTLTTANSALTSEITEVRKGFLDLAEKKGAFTPAERPAFETKLTTANSRAATLTELQTRKALNTTPIEINGNRVDLSTANARRDALDGAVSKRMDSDKCDRDTAFARVKADPNFTALFAAMQDPTKKAA